MPEITRVRCSDDAALYEDIEPYAYEAGSDQSFGLSGDGLAVASSTGLQLMRPDGATIAKSIFAMSAPAVSCSDTGAAVFFDVGGTAVRAVSAKGAITVLDSSQRVISARMGSSGAVAVCTEETGYKGAVTLYDSAFSAVFRWYSGTDFSAAASAKKVISSRLSSRPNFFFSIISCIVMRDSSFFRG